ncbi:hypothetical protein MMC22_005955, partial [Lobaria immixta]|nr:hypothetical protein [Lobaria immixta]
MPACLLTITFEILKRTMTAAQVAWAEAQRGGELTRHGSWPEVDQQELFRSYIKSYEEALSKTESSHPNHSYLESIVSDYREQLAHRKAKEESEAWVFPQALRILANMWGSVDPIAPSQTMNGEWRSFVKQMEGKWSLKMLKALLLLAA